MWETGVLLIEDDKQDLGYTTYSGRISHRYHGEIRPDHPSPFHHWQGGIALCALGQLFGFMGTLSQFKAAMEAENESLRISQRNELPIKFRTGLLKSA